MPASLTEQEFSLHLGTKFIVKLEPQPIELDLMKVQGYMSKENEHPGMERFSVFFNGPADLFLPQGLYLVSHGQMGEFEIFLVPIARDERGFQYEAVFNYFTSVPPAVAGG